MSEELTQEQLDDAMNAEFEKGFHVERGEVTPEPEPEVAAEPEVEVTPEPAVAPEPEVCLLYTSPSPRDRTRSRMPSSA